MNNNIKLIIELVENLESDFEVSINKDKIFRKILKNRALEILSNLKKDQDRFVNIEYNDIFEDLIERVISIVGQL
ncbi:MAG: hypothetical protein QM486_02355 [Flavobacteriaceae bacterium]